jgi:hypothetical protein
MTVTSYDDDPRVEKVNEYFFHVESDDSYNVTADNPTEWYVGVALDNRRLHEAGLRTREAADGWCKANQRGPFPSAEIALYQLLGPPQR